MTIPESCCDGRGGRGKETEDRTSEERQFRETLDSLGSMNKLTVSTQHLFGGERKLLDRPAVVIEGSDRSGLQSQRGCQQPRLVKGGIIDGVNAK